MPNKKGKVKNAIKEELKMKNRNLKHSDNWATPKEFYAELDKEFNFNFDPCPLNNDNKVWNGLNRAWKERNFINPPYSRKLKEAFVKKAIEESRKGKLCVMLLPVSTSTKLFHEVILPENPEIRFVFKRIKFCGINTKGEYVTTKAPMHDSMIVIFRNKKKIKYEKCHECGNVSIKGKENILNFARAADKYMEKGGLLIYEGEEEDDKI